MTPGDNGLAHGFVAVSLLVVAGLVGAVGNFFEPAEQVARKMRGKYLDEKIVQVDSLECSIRLYDDKNAGVQKTMVSFTRGNKFVEIFNREEVRFSDVVGGKIQWGEKSHLIHLYKEEREELTSIFDRAMEAAKNELSLRVEKARKTLAAAEQPSAGESRKRLMATRQLRNQGLHPAQAQAARQIRLPAKVG